MSNTHESTVISQHIELGFPVAYDEGLKCPSCRHLLTLESEYQEGGIGCPDWYDDTYTCPECNARWTGYHRA